MPTLQQLETALRNADAAGDTAAATALAKAYSEMRGQRESLLQKRDSFDANVATMQQDSTLGGAASGALQGLDDNMRLAANGASFGFLDKALGPGARAATDAARGRQGWTGFASEIGGSILPAAGLARAGATATRIPGAIGKYAGMALDGAGLGALQAVGNDKDVGTGAAFGAAGGLLGQALAPLLSKAAGIFNRRPQQMSPEQLKAMGSALYDQAEQAGVIFKPEAVGRLRDAVQKDFAEFGYHPKNQPGAAVAYDELARLADGGNVSLKGLDTARKLAQGGYNPVNPSNNALIGKATSRIDDLAASANPDDVLTGDAEAASAALTKARDYWGRFRKMEKVDELMGKAGLQAGSTGSGGNIENATRQQLKRLLTDKKQMRGMTPDEIAAVKKAVLGSTPQNALRLAGKLSPQGNGLMMALLGASTMTAPHIALPVAAAGFGAKKASEAMTRKNADLVRALIAAGGSKEALKAPKNAAQKYIEANKDLIARLLMGAATSPASTPR